MTSPAVQIGGAVTPKPSRNLLIQMIDRGSANPMRAQAHKELPVRALRGERGKTERRLVPSPSQPSLGVSSLNLDRASRFCGSACSAARSFFRERVSRKSGRQPR